MPFQVFRNVFCITYEVDLKCSIFVGLSSCLFRRKQVYVIFYHQTKPLNIVIQNLFLIIFPYIYPWKKIINLRNMYCFSYTSGKTSCTSIVLDLFWVMRHNISFWEITRAWFPCLNHGICLADIFKHSFSQIDLMKSMFHVL